MAESLEGSALGLATQPDAFLATKLYVPGSRPGFLTRPRLRAQLDGGRGQQLTLISAPAGFGKTTLLADWSRHTYRSVAWVALDTGDNDPVRLWRHVVAAFDRLRAGTALHVEPLLGPPTPQSFEGVIGALINELEAQREEEELLLVLDDYHQIDSPAAHSSLAFLVDHLPSRLHVAISSRADPPLPLARLRAAGLLSEVRAGDLRFTKDETGAVLREVLGHDVQLTEASLRALDLRTEGWAAGIQLAALSLRDHPDVNGFISSFSGSHRYVLDYLTEEVLERQAPEVRSFLLETSVLERLSGELCDAVTGRVDSQAMLEGIERANLFLVPLDDVRGWWRYHHLFADLLRVRLAQERPDAVASLHVRAAQWHDERGLADDAVRHALAAGDTRRAARLVEYYADGCIQGGREATLRRWLLALPPELVASRARLLLARSLVALIEGDLSVLEETLDAAEHAFASEPGDRFESSVGSHASWMGNVPAMLARGRGALAEFRGDADAALAYSRRAVELVAEGEHMLEALSRAVLGRAERLSGMLGDAERTFTDLIQRAQTTSQPALVAWACHLLAQVQQARGNLDGAGNTYRRAYELSLSSQQTGPLPGAIAHLGLAEVAYQRGELGQAIEHITRGVTLCRQTANATLVASGLTTLAWILQAQGDSAGAREAIDQAADVGLGSAVVDLINPVPARRARLLLTQGYLEAAAAWTAERGLEADDDAPYAQEPAYLTLGRVLRAQGRPDAALQLLEGLHERATQQGRTGSLIEIIALQSLALADAGDEPRAASHLSRALALAHPQGYVRVFADEGPDMGMLLGRLLASGDTAGMVGDVPATYVGRLIAAIDPPHDRATGTGQKGANRVVPGLVEGLSEREVEVLQLLASGKANREIADELFVTLHTVKKHITHILGKLGATNRTEAAARARDLGLLG